MMVDLICRFFPNNGEFSPPKNREVMAKFKGYPYLVLSHWNKYSNTFLASNTNMDINRETMEFDDVYFQTGSFEEHELEYWMEIPILEQGIDKICDRIKMQ